MSTEPNKHLTITGGLCGVAGTLCYLALVFVSMNNAATFFVAMLWPILSIVLLYSVYNLLHSEAASSWNTLAFIIGCIAFAFVAAMLAMQIAVSAGIEEYMLSATAADQETMKLIRRGVRLLDLGLDVAWDVFIGMALILLSVAMYRSKYFSPPWAIPAGVLGIALIGLNVVTFPWPPDTKGLFDIGPFIGLYIVALAVRVVFVGRRLPLSPSLQSPQ